MGDILIDNFYTKIKSESDNTTSYPNYSKLQIKLRKHVAIIGSTGSGKTNLLLNLIKLVGVFTRIYIFLKLDDEPLYQYFIESVRAKEKEIAKKIKEPSFKMLYVSNDINDLQEPHLMFDKDYENLLIFDDHQSSDMSLVLKHFEIDRKYNTTIYFLAQGFYKIHKNIRENISYFLFKSAGNARDLQLILSDYNYYDDVDKKVLNKIFNLSTRKLEDFFMIDRLNKEYRIKFKAITQEQINSI